VGYVTDFTGSMYPVGNTCEAGGFCPTGSKFPKPCPPGKYNNLPGKFLASACIACPSGKYCAGSPNIARTDVKPALAKNLPSADPTGLCSPGYYCTGSAYAPTQNRATPGYFVEFAGAGG